MENETVGQITNKVANISTDYERMNTELKRKYLLWNIEVFKLIASKVKVGKGTFGTGYPFYALEENLRGNLPVISEQIRYNRKLVEDGKTIGKTIWKCKKCSEKIMQICQI